MKHFTTTFQERVIQNSYKFTITRKRENNFNKNRATEKDNR